MKVLVNDKTHPTIKEIYDKVHLYYPGIGQATVYRNVNKLVENGLIRRISIDNDVDHYDGDTSNHYHFLCTTCNKIIDIFDKKDISIGNILKDCTIEKTEVILYGKCSNCRYK